jgi:hypothetical protein
VNADHLSKKRFFLLGGNDPTNKGIGNLLVFFPAEFYFAYMSSRYIIISDNSLIGQMCKEIKCGFPLLSEVLTLSPHLFSDYSFGDVVHKRILTSKSNNNLSPKKSSPSNSHPPVKRMKTLHAMNFAEYSQDHSNFIHDIVVTASGYDAKSDWWAYSNKSAQCVISYTGCAVQDIHCFESFAFQRLILGPFRGPTTKLAFANSVIQGVSASWISHLFVDSLKNIPKLNAAVHLRNQFLHFEMEFDASNADFQKEVGHWIASNEAGIVFESLISKLKQLRRSQFHNNFTVYVAADNEDVKQAFVNKLRNTTANMIQPVYIQSDHLYHVKNFKQVLSSSKGFGMFNVVFDWVALSLSKCLLAWRKEGTRASSTFLFSARRVFEHHESDDVTLQLVKTKRGEIVFEPI